MSRTILSNVRGLIGAAIGGVVGFFAFAWILRYGFYAMILPGGLVGFGSELLAMHRSQARGIACALGALLLGLFAEWHERPFNADGGAGYFLRHLHELTPITWIMIGLGTFLAYYWGRESLRPGETRATGGDLA